jgi:isopenicillin N synthase-like dioxygenase
MSEVPFVNIGPFGTAESKNRRSIARTVRDACETIGFLVIEGHGIPEDLYKRAMDLSLAFFGLPEDEKSLCLPPQDTVPRGYQRFATRRLAITRGIETPPDLREQFFMGPLVDRRNSFAEIPGAAPFYEPNVWPAKPEGFRSTFEEIYRQHERLAFQLMRIFAVSLGVAENYFDSRIDRHFSTGTSSHYPPQSQAAQPSQLRCGEHTDFGSLTILRPSGSGKGLQVQGTDGEWSDVQIEPGQLVINLGDMMQRWTNDRWRSTVHRVINPPSAERHAGRQSIAFFLHPNYDTEIRCIETCVSAGEEPKYAGIRAGDWMRDKLIRRTT